MRFNRKFIEARFAMAMDAIGVQHGQTYANGKAIVGVHFVDYSSVYGGYKIRKMATEGGGESEPFGSSRYTASEFVSLLDGILGAAHIMKGH